MPRPLEINARLFQEGDTYSVSILIRKQMKHTEVIFWNYYNNFRSPEQAAVWFFARYDDTPLVWHTEPNSMTH